VSLRFRSADLSIDLSHALFSSHDIDAGSKLLLKLVGTSVPPASVGTVLDIGSGTGVLGLACALGYPGSSVGFRDRDALACAFTLRNARKNGVQPAFVDHALFLDRLGGREFDLVVCNVPAKAGTPVLDAFMRELPGVLSARGHGAVVVVNPIAAAAEASLAASGCETVRVERGAGHAAILFRRGSAPALVDPRDPVDRYRRTPPETATAGPFGYRHAGYWSLPEFDTPSFATALAGDVLDAALAGLLARRVAVVNPGSGRLACRLRASTGAAVDACGRDRLALEATAANLVLNGADRPLLADRAAGLPPRSYDLVAEYVDLVPLVDATDASWDAAADLLKSGGSYLAVMPSANRDRFERRRPARFVRVRDKRHRGWTAGVWRFEP